MSHTHKRNCSVLFICRKKWCLLLSLGCCELYQAPKTCNYFHSNQPTSKYSSLSTTQIPHIHNTVTYKHTFLTFQWKVLQGCIILFTFKNKNWASLGYGSCLHLLHVMPFCVWKKQQKHAYLKAAINWVICCGAHTCVHIKLFQGFNFYCFNKPTKAFETWPNYFSYKINF